MRLLFDIGATKTRLATIEDGKTFGEPLVIPTESDFEAGMAAFAAAAKKLIKTGRAEFAVGGAAGPFDRDKTTMVNAPNFPNWRRRPLKQRLEDIAQAPVFLENDAALAGVGEWAYGAGRGHGIVAYLTVSTGVGGARITNGAIDASAQGFEPGHHIIEAKTRLTFEAAVSGSAVERRFGVKPQTISDAGLWEELAEKLAVGIHNAIVFWSPDVVILGGSMILGDPAIPLDRTEAHLAALPQIFPELPKIEKAALGDFSVLYGALALANR
ncbi:MAG: ROK family protein [Candidatus Niyogibacteria bacterium]|nr:ROK family protein [Candidatus Niyogibacteria bacterium]